MVLSHYHSSSGIKGLFQNLTIDSSNSTGNSTFNRDITYSSIALGCVLITISLFILSGNTLVIVAVLTTKRLRTITNQYVVSLAAADLLVSLLVLPLSVTMQISQGQWPFSPAVCKFWLSMDIFLCTASILNLCCISVDRYLAITRPVIYATKRSKHLARVMIACVWLFSVIITLPSIADWRHKTWGDKRECSISRDKTYRIYSALGSFFVPFVVMLFVYCSIFFVAYQRTKMLLNNNPRPLIRPANNLSNRKRCSNISELDVTTFSSHHANNLNVNSDNPESIIDDTVQADNEETPPIRSTYLRCDSGESQQFRKKSDAGINRQRKPSAIMQFLFPSHYQFQPVLSADAYMQRPANASALQQLLYDSRLLASITAIPVQCVQYVSSAKQVRFLKEEERRENERVVFRKEHKTAKTLAVVVGCFSVCWLPFFLVYLLEPFLLKPVYDQVFTTVTWLGYTNSIFNPFIYAFYNKEYATAFKRLLCKKRFCK